MDFKIFDGRTEFYQWDHNQKVIVPDASISAVHFCNGTEDCSLVSAVYELDGKLVADVPSILLTDHPVLKLQDYFTLKVYSYCGLDGATKSVTYFRVNKKSKPEDYVYTEEEINTWGDLYARIMDVEAQVDETSSAIDGKIDKSQIVHETGDSETAFMSQKAVTDELAKCYKGELKKSANLLDESKGRFGIMWDGAVGSAPFARENEYTPRYVGYELEVPSNAHELTLCGYMKSYNNYGTLYSIIFVNSSGVILEMSVGINQDLYGVVDNEYVEHPYTFTVPEGTAKIYINIRLGIAGEPIPLSLFEGAEGKEYEPFGIEVVFPRLDGIEEEITEVKEIVETMDNTVENIPRIVVPDKWCAVVGDTLQLFYRGIIEHPNPYIFNIEVVCDIGKNTSRYFEVTPTSANVGEHTLTVNLRDCKDNIIASASTILEVVNVATNPTRKKNILCVGDSLTSSGVWCNELDRRLTKTGGTPNGDGLNNIAFIGTCKRTETEYPTKFEGYGGWTWEHYLRAPSVTTSDIWIYCTHDKTDDDQHSIWRDGNGNLWSLETIEGTRLKFTRHNAHSGAMPNSGTLSHNQNATHSSNITYTSIQIADGNPFWDTNTNSVNFVSYCSRNGFDGIDVVYTLLTWNGGAGALYDGGLTALETQVEDAKTFLRTLHSQYPNAIVKLMGIQLPSLNGGCGANYGAQGRMSNVYAVSRYVFEMNIAYQALANDTEFSNYVEFVNISAQFDSENNMAQTEKAVNTRNADIKEMVGTNGVHPTWYGYWQIADAAYRSIHAFGL